jgi:uncharacterized membrane protein
MAHKNENLVVVVASYGSEIGAEDALMDLQRLDKGKLIDLVDAAVVVHDEEGKVTFKETHDPSGKSWGKRGAIAGGVVGLIFPPSIIAGAVVGGAGGGLWGKIRDKGFKDDQLKAVGEHMPPGTSAIIAVTQETGADGLADRLTGYSRITRQQMDADASKMVLAEAEESSE